MLVAERRVLFEIFIHYFVTIKNKSLLKNTSWCSDVRSELPHKIQFGIIFLGLFNFKIMRSQAFNQANGNFEGLLCQNHSENDIFTTFVQLHTACHVVTDIRKIWTIFSVNSSAFWMEKPTEMDFTRS